MTDKTQDLREEIDRVRYQANVFDKTNRRLGDENFKLKQLLKTAEKLLFNVVKYDAHVNLDIEKWLEKVKDYSDGE